MTYFVDLLQKQFMLDRMAREHRQGLLSHQVLFTLEVRTHFSFEFLQKLNKPTIVRFRHTRQQVFQFRMIAVHQSYAQYD